MGFGRSLFMKRGSGFGDDSEEKIAQPRKRFFVGRGTRFGGGDGRGITNKQQQEQKPSRESDVVLDWRVSDRWIVHIRVWDAVWKQRGDFGAVADDFFE
jgi:hypothetical protein